MSAPFVLSYHPPDGGIAIVARIPAPRLTEARGQPVLVENSPGAKRLPFAPDIPTVAETSPGFEVVNWYGTAVPAPNQPAKWTRVIREANIKPD